MHLASWEGSFKAIASPYKLWKSGFGRGAAVGSFHWSGTSRGILTAVIFYFFYPLTNVKDVHLNKNAPCSWRVGGFSTLSFHLPKASLRPNRPQCTFLISLFSFFPSFARCVFLPQHEPSISFQNRNSTLAPPHPSFSGRCVIWGPQHHHHLVPPPLSLHLSHWVNFVQSVIEFSQVSAEEALPK